MTERTDIYQRITDQIIQAIESGARKWTMPWHQSCGVPANATTQKRYRGVNILNLWAIAVNKSYNSALWATYSQWDSIGAQVRKGEKASFVVFWKFFDHEQQDDGDHNDQQGATTTRRGPMARCYPVFNADQVDGFQPPSPPDPLTDERNQNAEAFFANTGAIVRHGGDQAFYSPATDHIQMPPFEAFHSVDSYYSTLAHEAIHFSGAPHRLNRDIRNRFGSEAYAAEELIADLGSAFVCADLGLASEPRPDHAAYLQHWLTVLKSDRRAIFTAASHAQRAVDFLHSLQPQQHIHESSAA